MAIIKFEEAVKKLEETVGALETGDLTLDESLSKYEDGIRTYRTCQKLLEEAEKKVQALIEGENGQPKAVPFDEDASASPADEASK